MPAATGKPRPDAATSACVVSRPLPRPSAPALPKSRRRSGTRRESNHPTALQPAPAGNAVMKRQVAAQKRQMLAAPQGHAVEVVAIGHRGANDEQQDLRQRVGDAPRLARIVNDRKAVKQRPKTRFFRKSIKDK